MSWVQLFVSAPDGNGYTSRHAMKRVDDHLTSQLPGVFMNVPAHSDDLPIQESDGTWEVRILDASPIMVRLVQGILTGHYGLNIVREVYHE